MKRYTLGKRLLASATPNRLERTAELWRHRYRTILRVRRKLRRQRALLREQLKDDPSNQTLILRLAQLDQKIKPITHELIVLKAAQRRLEKLEEQAWTKETRRHRTMRTT